MILGKDVNPKKQIYYLSAQILYELNQTDNKEFDYLYIYHRIKLNEDISLNLYTLSLDWLFILGAIKRGKNGLLRCI